MNTKKIRTEDLDGKALNWAVSKCEWHREEGNWSGRLIADYVTDWANGGPLIEELKKTRKLTIMSDATGLWKAIMTPDENEPHLYYRHYGESQLIAVLRCYVNSEMGGEIDVPLQYIDLADFSEDAAASPAP